MNRTIQVYTVTPIDLEAPGGPRVAIQPVTVIADDENAAKNLAIAAHFGGERVGTNWSYMVKREGVLVERPDLETIEVDPVEGRRIDL